MANLNKVLLIGRLTADPELRRTPNDIPVASFTLAVNRRYSQNAQQQADFIDIVCWRNNAEFAAKYFTKGMAAFVSGTLQIRSWKDRDGQQPPQRGGRRGRRAIRRTAQRQPAA